MIILLLYLFTGWFLVSLTINLTNFIFSKLLRTIPSKLKILLILINGFFWIIIFSMILYDLLNESMNGYCIGNTEKDVEEVAKNISINSPYEYSEILEGIKIILFCTEILSTLAIISFIFYSLFIYIKYVDFNKLKFKNKFTLKFINLVQKVSLVYTLFWGVLTLFNLSVILYLSIRLSNFLDTLTV